MNDARYALRGLLRTPGFTAVAILSLARGIGANVTIYSVANTFLARPIAGVADPDGLVRVYRGRHSALQYRDLAFVRDDSPVFANGIGEQLMPAALANNGGTERVVAALVTPGYFSTLGVRAAAGGLFGADATERSVVLSDNLWRRWFGGDVGIIGQAIRVNDHAFTVVGVAPPEFISSMSLWRADLWLSPAGAQAVIGEPFERWGGSLYATARLREGMTRISGSGLWICESEIGCGADGAATSVGSCGGGMARDQPGQREAPCGDLDDGRAVEVEQLSSDCRSGACAGVGGDGMDAGAVFAAA